MKHTILIKQGTVHDGIHREPYVADILVEKGKITRIEPALEKEEFQDIQVLDASGLEVYPGFVEAHCHLGLDGYAIGFEGADYNEMTDLGKETGAEILETGKPDTEIPETAESLGKDVEDMFAVMERFRMMTAADAEISVAGTNETDLMIVMGNYLRTVDV